MKSYVDLLKATRAILPTLALSLYLPAAISSDDLPDPISLDQQTATEVVPDGASQDQKTIPESDSFSLGLYAKEKIIQLKRLLKNRKEQAALVAYELGVEAAQEGDLEEAYKYISEAIRLSPDNLQYLQAAVELAFLKGDYEQAETLELVAIEQLRSEEADISRELSDLLDNLGTIYAAQELYDEAESSFQESLALREQAYGGNHLLVAVSLNKLATLAVHKDHPAIAESLLKRSLDIAREVSGPRHANSAAVLANLADLYQNESRMEEAEALYEEAISIWEESPDDQPLRRAIGLNALGQLYLRQQRFDDARVQLEQVLSLLQANYADDHPYVEQAKSNLVALDAESGSDDEAEHIYEALVREFNQQLQRREAITTTIPPSH